MSYSDPQDSQYLTFWCPTSGLCSYVENYDIPGGQTGSGGYTALTDTAKVGQVTCSGGPYCAWIGGSYHSSSIKAPTLSKDPNNTSAAMWAFGTSATDYKGILVNNTNKAFNFVHQTGVFSVRAKVQITSAGTTTGYTILCNTDRGTNHPGFCIYVYATNRIAFWLCDGTATLNNTGSTTGGSAGTGTEITTNVTWDVLVTMNGWGNSLSYTLTPYSGSTPGTPITFSTTAPSWSGHTAADAYAFLCMGNKYTNTNNAIGTSLTSTTASQMVGYIADPLICNGVISYNDGYQTYLPTQNTTTGNSINVYRNSGTTINGALDPKSISHRWINYDFSTNCYEDVNSYGSGFTYATPATANGNSINTVTNGCESLMGLPNGTTQREAIKESTSSAAPTITTPCENNRAFAKLAGTSTTWTAWDVASPGVVGQAEHCCGDSTVIITVKNTNTGDSTGNGEQGSFFYGSSVGGVLIFGNAAWSGHANLVEFRCGNGSSTGVVRMQLSDLNLNGCEWLTIAGRKTATSLKMWVNGVSLNNVSGVPNPATLSADCYLGSNGIGYMWQNPSQPTDVYQPTGNIYLLNHYAVALTDNDIIAVSNWQQAQVTILQSVID